MKINVDLTLGPENQENEWGRTRVLKPGVAHIFCLPDSGHIKYAGCGTGTSAGASVS